MNLHAIRFQDPLPESCSASWTSNASRSRRRCSSAASAAAQQFRDKTGRTSASQIESW